MSVKFTARVSEEIVLGAQETTVLKFVNGDTPTFTVGEAGQLFKIFLEQDHAAPDTALVFHYDVNYASYSYYLTRQGYLLQYRSNELDVEPVVTFLRKLFSPPPKIPNAYLEIL